MFSLQINPSKSLTSCVMIFVLSTSSFSRVSISLLTLPSHAYILSSISTRALLLNCTSANSEIFVISESGSDTCLFSSHYFFSNMLYSFFYCIVESLISYLLSQRNWNHYSICVNFYIYLTIKLYWQFAITIDTRGWNITCHPCLSFVFWVSIKPFL